MKNFIVTDVQLLITTATLFLLWFVIIFELQIIKNYVLIAIIALLIIIVGLYSKIVQLCNEENLTEDKSELLSII